MKSPLWWRRFKARVLPARHLNIIKGDSLPQQLPRRHVVLARDGNEDWCVGMHCPCGCGRTIELLVVQGVAPRWDLHVDDRGLPTLEPSVFLQTGCRSHFWLRQGRVQWCD
jgi:hypothetical protein